METATQIGLTPLEFWQLTPAELDTAIRGYIQKMRRDRDKDITMAYLNAYFQRVNKMPKLDKFLSENTSKPKPKQTANAMLEMVKRMNAAFGGTVT